MPTNNSLHAFYDLGVSPISFDFICFLVEAERHRRALDLGQIIIVIVPEDQLDPPSSNISSPLNNKWRQTNLLTPSCWLLPSCNALTICSDRDQAEAIAHNLAKHIFPKDYSVSEPVAHHHTGLPVLASHHGYNLQCLTSSAAARSYVRQWLNLNTDGKRAITLTLREAAYTPKRNSDFKVWIGIAQRLKEKGFCPIIVRDTDKALDAEPEELDGIKTFAVAAFNLEMRMALYEESHICAFVSNGPSTPCYYSRNVNYVYFATGEWLDKNNTTFNRIGIEWGSTPPFANEFQRWVWKEQDIETYVGEIFSLDKYIRRMFVKDTPTTLLDPISTNRRNGYEIALTIEKWCRGQEDKLGANSDNIRPEIGLALNALKNLGHGDISQAEVWRLAGSLQKRINDRAGIIDSYARAAEISGSESDYLEASDAMDLGINHKEMMDYYEHVLERYPTFIKIETKLAELKKDRKQIFAYDYTTFAEVIYKFLAWYKVEEAPKKIEEFYGSLGTPQARLFLAAFFLIQNQHDEATEQFEKLLSLGFRTWSIMFRLGICYMNLGRLSEAINIFEQIDLENIKSVQITLALGYIYSRMGNVTKALEVYKRAEVFGFANDEILRCIAELEKLSHT